MSIDLTNKDWKTCSPYVQSKLEQHDRELRDAKLEYRGEIAGIKKDVQENKISVAKLMVYAGLAAMIGMAIFQSALKYGRLE